VKIAVLHTSPKPTWTTRRLLAAISEKGATPMYILWNYMAVDLGSRSCPLRYRGRCLDADAIIVRSLGRGVSLERYTARRAMLEAAKDYGYTVVNPPPAVFIARDKFTSLRLLHEAGLPVPRTILTEDPSQALHAIEEMGSVVFKPIMGSLGLGSFKVDDVDTGYHIVNLLLELNQPLYVQKYIEKRGNRDIRVFVVESQPIAAMYRVSVRGTWKTNVAQGAKPIPANPPKEVLEDAVRAVEVLGLVYAGVDIAETGSWHVIFEVNASPLWRGLYSATGVDPAPAIVEATIRRVKK
jgi:ribosomal protein S6--L-glutamate ligase